MAVGLTKKQRPLIVLTIVYWATILTLTHIPVADIPAIPGKDKTIHALAYCGGTLLTLAIFWKEGKAPSIIAIILSLGILGIADETTQRYFNRTCSLLDWVADLIGIITAVFIFWATRKLTIKHNVGDKT